MNNKYLKTDNLLTSIFLLINKRATMSGFSFSIAKKSGVLWKTKEISLEKAIY